MKALARMSVTVLALCASPQAGVLCAAAESLPQGPLVGDQDLSPFYRWTAALPEKPGLMLREEGIPDQPEIVAAATTRRILYTSTDARWRSGIIPVSGTLYFPKRAAPQGGWPLVAWAHGTLGVSDRCARPGAGIDRGTASTSTIGWNKVSPSWRLTTKVSAAPGPILI